MLITNAEIVDLGAGRSELTSLRISDGRVTTVGPVRAGAGEPVLDAKGCAVLPGLHDHHMHLLSYAASLESVHCGPPAVQTETDLAETLRADSGSGWLRGYGYHESVAGDIDRAWLDQVVEDRPVRVQHRSGRLWVLNAAALRTLRALADVNGNSGIAIDLPPDGRLYDRDQMLGDLLGRTLPPVGRASRRLAGFGVTGLTDMTPSNDTATMELFRALRRNGTLLQTVQVAGSPALDDSAADGVTSAATKIHLHESGLPPFEQLRELIRNSHARRRPVAVHCVTEVELVFALGAIEEAGSRAGDRIEHASVTPPPLLDKLRELGLLVVTQPNFIAERGDAYLDDIASDEWSWLYRARSFIHRGIPFAVGTDAPFGGADPWIAIRAAVDRTTAGGRVLGPAESLSPEAAVALFVGSPDEPDRPR
ncbi:MAG: amidohydrolase family protein, partial [Gammaproteobacteria bacterium]